MSDRRNHYGIYRRGKVAAQFKLQDKIDRPGVFLEITDKAVGDAFNWDDKIVVKLGINDLGTIVDGLERQIPSFALFHDPGAGSETAGEVKKNIQFNKNKTGGYYLNLSVIDGKDTRKISITIAEVDIEILITLFRVAIPAILRWN